MFIVNDAASAPVSQRTKFLLRLIGAGSRFGSVGIRLVLLGLISFSSGCVGFTPSMLVLPSPAYAGFSMM
mgnify:CR=1 FL=1